MKSITVKELMVPLSEYATVDEEATLEQALDALGQAQEKFDRSRYRHRAVLVLEKGTSRVVGKLSQMDVIRSLEPKYEQFTQENSFPQSGMGHVGFSPKFMKAILEQYELWYEPLQEICRKSGGKKVRDIMYRPAAGEYVKENANLGEAVHQLIMGHHQSLLVTRGEDIVGVLRLTDIFKAVCLEHNRHRTKGA